MQGCKDHILVNILRTTRTSQADELDKCLAAKVPQTKPYKHYLKERIHDSYTAGPASQVSWPLILLVEGGSDYVGTASFVGHRRVGHRRFDRCSHPTEKVALEPDLMVH